MRNNEQRQFSKLDQRVESRRDTDGQGARVRVVVVVAGVVFTLAKVRSKSESVMAGTRPRVLVPSTPLLLL